MCCEHCHCKGDGKNERDAILGPSIAECTCGFYWSVTQPQCPIHTTGPVYRFVVGDPMPPTVVTSTVTISGTVTNDDKRRLRLRLRGA